MNDIADEYFAESIGGTRENFIEFIKINWPEVLDETNPEYADYAGDIEADIDRLAHRVAQNMYYFKQNISTAKSDYILLLALLMRKGVIFKKQK